MVQGVGGTGQSGSISNLVEYQVYYPMYQQYNQDNGCNLSFEAYLTLKGYMQNFTQKVENYLEGDIQNGDGVNGNNLDANKHISNGVGAIYQGADDETFYEFDYDSGTYRVLTGSEEIAEALGLGSGENIDTVNIGYQNVNITDYTFGNLDDGQDSSKYKVDGNYGHVSYTKQEFDIHYILNALLMDPSDPQYNIAKEIFDALSANAGQWLPKADAKELDAIAAKYGTNSVEYKDKLKDVLLKNLDQAQEWVDEHAHVEKPSDSSLLPDEPTGGEGEGGEGGNNKPGDVPKYDKNTVVDNAGLLADYTSNKTWKGESFNLKGRSSDEARNLAIANATAYASQLLSSLEAQLIAQLGEGCTDEIRKYITKAKATTLQDRSWVDTKYDGGVLNKNKHQTAYVKSQVLMDKFFSEFNALCANKGKSSSEVAADQKASEEKKAKETAAYKSLYSMNMKNEAKEAGVDPNKDIQVVNANSAADIQAKAESQILGPLKAKLKAKLAGKGISDSDLTTILENASKAALASCTDWSSTSNNYVYTIDTDKLINKFEENVKTVIRNKGYDF